MATQFPKMGLLKIELANLLSMDTDCKKIMTLLNWSKGKQDRMKSVEDLLNDMESTSFITEDNFQRLVDTLEKLDLNQAAAVVRKYMSESAELSITVSDRNSWRSFKEKFYYQQPPGETAPVYQFVPGELNFVLIGKTGSGKSATGNTLVGEECFKEGDGTTSQTKTISLHTFVEEDRKFTIIDTPGLFDTKKDFTNEEILLEVVKTMNAFYWGIHLFLLVCKADMRFTDEEQKTIQTIEKILSQNIYNHCVIVLTRARSQFGGKKKKPLSHFIEAEKKEQGEFAHLIGNVRGRIVAVENDFDEDGIAKLHRQTLLRYLMTLVDTKKGGVFSNKLFKEIEERNKRDETARQARIKRAEELSLMEYRVQEFLYDCFLDEITIENLNNISNVLEDCVDQIKKNANVSNLNYVDRDDIIHFLKAFAKENKCYIQSLAEKKSQERALQKEKRERDEINAAIVGEELLRLLMEEPQNTLDDFKACLEQKDSSRVKDFLSKFACKLEKSISFDTSDMGNIEGLLQMYCLDNTEVAKRNVEAILERMLIMERVKEEYKRQKQRSRVLCIISGIIDKDLEKYLASKTLLELHVIEKQIQKGKIPTDIFYEVKSKLTEDECAQLDNESIEAEILYAIKSRKSRIDHFVRVTGLCFSGSALVQTKSNGSKNISAVKVNDEILVFDDEGHLFHEKVYLISHANATDEVMYIRLATQQGKVLFISPDHILPIGGLCKHIPAKDAVVGDVVFTINHGVLTPDVVTSVSYQLCKGAFCPMTLSGNIVVNDVAASCYTTFVYPTLAHILLSPFRIMFKYLPTSVFNTMLPYDSVEGMPLVLAASCAAVNFMRSTFRYLRLL